MSAFRVFQPLSNLLYRRIQVVLEIKGREQLEKLASTLEEENVLHKLWLEQPENFPTCLATKPYPKGDIGHYFKKLKLCN